MDKVVFLWLKDGHYSAILDVGKFLYYEKVNYCCKCMKQYRSAFDHVCLLPIMCIKCYSVHDDESDGKSTKCPLCDVFYREDCLRNHFNQMLTLHDKGGGEHQKSCCQFFKYCPECYSVVRQCEWINNHWYHHDCSTIYCDYCKEFQQEPHLCCMKSIDMVVSSSLCERTSFFDFETCCDGFNMCFEVYYCVVNVVCKSHMNGLVL